MRLRSVWDFCIFVILLFLVVALILYIYINLANQIEVERVKAVIRRDCALELDISSDDIREPGVVMKDYVDNGTSIRVICEGSNWTCQCDAK